jgi:hypothetical protein
MTGLTDISDVLMQDPYMLPYLGADYRPSMFYFIQFSFMLTACLSLTVNMLDSPAQVAIRCSINLLLLSSMLFLVLSSQPYKQEHRYSQHVQTAVLCIAILVTLMDLIGTRLSDTELESGDVRSSSLSARTFIKVLAYFILVAMIGLALALLYLFFKDLVAGARDEQEKIEKAQRPTFMNRVITGARKGVTSVGIKIAGGLWRSSARAATPAAAPSDTLSGPVTSLVDSGGPEGKTKKMTVNRSSGTHSTRNSSDLKSASIIIGNPEAAVSAPDTSTGNGAAAPSSGSTSRIKHREAAKGSSRTLTKKPVAGVSASNNTAETIMKPTSGIGTKTLPGSTELNHYFSNPLAQKRIPKPRATFDASPLSKPSGSNATQ